MIPNVLLVDDDPLLLQGLVRSLAREPYNLFCAANAEGALAMLRSEHISVMLCDDQMPGMPGSELIALVHDEFPTVLSIMLTGQATIGSLVHALNHGHVFRVMLKPCRADEVGANIRRALVHQQIWSRCRDALPLLRDLGNLLDEVARTDYNQLRTPALVANRDAKHDLDDLAAALDAEVEHAKAVLARRRP